MRYTLRIPENSNPLPPSTAGAMLLQLRMQQMRIHPTPSRNLALSLVLPSSHEWWSNAPPAGKARQKFYHLRFPSSSPHGYTQSFVPLIYRKRGERKLDERGAIPTYRGIWTSRKKRTQGFWASAHVRHNTGRPSVVRVQRQDVRIPNQLVCVPFS